MTSALGGAANTAEGVTKGDTAPMAAQESTQNPRIHSAAHVTAADVTDIIEQQTTVYGRAATDERVAVAEGGDVRVVVSAGQLVVIDGEERAPRERRFPRVGSQLRRLVVFGRHGGYVSWDALRWLDALRAALVQVDPFDGRLMFFSVPRGIDDARLRRAQAGAPFNAVGLSIVVGLLTIKLTGQMRIARELLSKSDAADTLESLLAVLPDAETIDSARQLEATAANCYWNSWAASDGTVPRFARRDLPRVPDHWRRFDGRRSTLGAANANRRAERPTNAVLNYCYALAEVECRLAILALGLDQGLGVLHYDARGRDSLALDLLEGLRPSVEEFVISLLSERSWRRCDFHEAPDGSVMLGLEVRHRLAATMARWARLAAPIAEGVATTLGHSLDGRYVSSAPLSGAKRRAAAATVKARKTQIASDTAKKRSVRPNPSRVTPQLFRTCRRCGGPLAGGMSNRPNRQTCCESCWDLMPGQLPSQRRKRGRAIAASRAELERWNAEHPGMHASPEVFVETIQPGLVGVKLSDIMAACCVAKSTASMIRSGRYVPAQRHWEALASLCDHS